MARRATLPTALALLLLAAVPAPAAPRSLPAPTPSAETEGEARPLKAWLALCDRLPAECAVDTAEARRVTLDQRTWDTIVTVNARLNRTITAAPDPTHWGVDDRWDMAEDGRGDCEDYALAKRAALSAAGLPRRAMRMTVVRDERGEGHAVLTLITDRGDLILDNRTSQILPWRRTGYAFVKREDQDVTGWLYLADRGDPVLTSARRPDR